MILQESWMNADQPWEGGDEFVNGIRLKDVIPSV
jgi:hypothetical protein